MRGPYGFEIIDNCQTCKTRKSSFFCQFTLKVMKDFDGVKSSSAYPAGAMLFSKNRIRGVSSCFAKAK